MSTITTIVHCEACQEPTAVTNGYSTCCEAPTWTTTTAAEPDTFRTVLLRTALDLGAADPNPAFSALLQQMGNLTWMPLDAREQFDAMLRANFTGSINEDEEAYL